MPPARSDTDGAGACRARVVGLGSPVGDDRAGWEVVARLRDALSAGTCAEITSDTLRVVDGPFGCELLVLIDACRGAGPPGSLHRFEWPDPRLTAGGGVSSHGVSLGAALELAGVLGRLPARVVVLAVEGESDGPGAELSRAVESALPELAARVLAELAAEPSRSRE